VLDVELALELELDELVGDEPPTPDVASEEVGSGFGSTSSPHATTKTKRTAHPVRIAPEEHPYAPRQGLPLDNPLPTGNYREP